MRPTKTELRLRRKHRIRARVSGDSTRPRLTVFCSLKSISVQVIDDVNSKTLASASSKEIKQGKNIAAAVKLGELIAKKVTAIKVTSVVFDRNGRKYHGRIKALADAARAGGLTF